VTRIGGKSPLSLPDREDSRGVSVSQGIVVETRLLLGAHDIELSMHQDYRRLAGLRMQSEKVCRGTGIVRTPFDAMNGDPTGAVDFACSEQPVPTE
jgi:hypothetical protein